MSLNTGHPTPASGSAAAGAFGARGGDAVTSSVWITGFIIALIVPIQIYVGDIRLSFYRIALLLALFPVLSALAQAKGLRWRLADTLIVAFAVTGAVSLAVTKASVAAIGIFLIESLGPYFLTRVFIRNAAQFSAMVRVLVICIIITIPFAFYENLTRDPIVLSVLGKVMTVISNVPHEQRLGLDRAQVTFDHPILYGVFCAFGFSLAVYAYRDRLAERLWIWKGSLVGLAAFLSLSSGAIVAVGLQLALIAYDRVMRAFKWRWTALAISFTSIFTVLEAASNRSMAQIMVPYLALNSGTAYTRLIVNDWAISGIVTRPWFGFGFTYHWPAPFWVVTTSIDNFWIAMAFRHGVPTVAFLIAAIAAILWPVIFTRQKDPFVNACRTSFVITVIGICVAIITVHLWNSTYVAFMFLLGSGMWLTEEQESAADATPKDGASDATERKTPYARDLRPTYRR